ncbi:MAG TPA: anti-sigma regulatory factor [Steroidobacteraceae bacterium]|nr:anti-sigma regulatory factor [Steroidobacteraceae bacterium]
MSAALDVELNGATPQIRHLIDEESKVGEARRQATLLAQRLGFDATAIGRVAIAATELATNLIKHGGGGELLIQPVHQADCAQVELLAIDRGPGMADIQRCLADGYSTAGSAGTGLGAVKRLTYEFDIYSVGSEGTVVVARLGPDTRKMTLQGKRFGAVSIPVAGEVECGDGWRLAVRGGDAAIMMVDGLGHGSLAATAARAALSAFETAPFDAPREIIERAHRVSAGGRGAAAACAALASDGTVKYAGVGNIGGSLVSTERSQGMVSHGGTLGVTVRRVQQFDYQRSRGALTIMHSDGVSARWDLKTRPGLLQCHPAIVAAILYRDHARERDDSTVLVVSA